MAPAAAAAADLLARSLVFSMVTLLAAEEIESLAAYVLAAAYSLAQLAFSEAIELRSLPMSVKLVVTELLTADPVDFTFSMIGLTDSEVFEPTFCIPSLAYSPA